MAIQVRNIYKSFGNPPTEILHDISFDIPDGSLVSLTGKSGSGKSTLLYIISSLDVANSGEVLLDNIRTDQINEKDLHKLRNTKIGFIFQFHYLLPEFTALENVLMPSLKAGQAPEKKAWAQELLERFELSHRMHHFPHQLSGGESQRVAVARALVMNPSYIFADEPTGSLDSINSKNVARIFTEINAAQKCSIIYVTHDEEFAAQAGLQIKLHDGRIAEIIDRNKKKESLKKNSRVKTLT